MKKQLMLGFVLLSGFTAGTIEGFVRSASYYRQSHDGIRENDNKSMPGHKEGKGLVFPKEGKGLLFPKGITGVKPDIPLKVLNHFLDYSLDVALKSVYLTEKEKSALINSLIDKVHQTMGKAVEKEAAIGEKDYTNKTQRKLHK